LRQVQSLVFAHENCRKREKQSEPSFSIHVFRLIKTVSLSILFGATLKCRLSKRRLPKHPLSKCRLSKC
jgi:hypothetical protein